MSIFDLTGKVALVTGSSRGIGKAIAVQLAQHGARVVISSRKAESCEVVAQEIRAAGGAAMARACHVGHKEELQALVEAANAAWGRIDIVVCNAATNPHFGPLARISDEAFEKIIHNNVLSTLWLCNMTLPGMAERRDGAVIIVSSVSGFIGSAMLGAYGISKAADMQLARNLAVEWGPHNIRAAAIASGYPLRRLGEPQDIAGAAVLLASRAGSFITGQALIIDGGGLIGSGEPLK
jgi:NAD(P)-dependent dehydrogenase (short-subunit alcohol dehydrogenase family)